MKTYQRFLAVFLLTVAGGALPPFGGFGVSFGLAASVAWAEGKPQALIKEKVFDFGSVSEGALVKHDFTVKNNGDADLVIQRVVPSCGCTVASVSSDPVKPGDERQIHVEFDTAGFSGEKYKTVRVNTNDIDNLSLVLSLKGVVEPEVQVEPQSVFLDEVIKGAPPEKYTKLVTVSVREGAKVSIQGVKAFSSALVVQEKESSPRKKVFAVSLDPSVPVGELRDRFVVGLEGARESTINVPVFASVQGQLALSPPQLSFGIIEGKDSLQRSVKFENRGEELVHVRSVKPNNPAVNATFKEIVPGKTYVIQVSLDPSKVNRDLRAAVEVQTDSGQEPSLSLSLFGVLPPKA